MFQIPTIIQRLILISLFILSINSCSENNNFSGKPADLPGPVVAIINGVELKEMEYQYLRIINPENNSAEAMMNSMIDVELLRQQAMQDKLYEDEKVAIQLNFQMSQMLANAVMQKITRNISEEEIKVEYNKYFSNFSSFYYKSRHILLNSKETALDIIKQLNAGASFAELAKSHSIADDSEQGGDLGWHTISELLPEYGNALKALNDGEYTKEAVQTSKGWHIILREKTNDLNNQPLSYEDYKPLVVQELTRKRSQALLDKLRNEANLVIH